jgi:hypothetical protein
MQESIYVGLDLGSSRCHQTVINADGSLQLSRVIPTSEHPAIIKIARRRKRNRRAGACFTLDCFFHS